MKILETLWAYRLSDRTALISAEGSLSYRELWQKSENLAYWISQNYVDNQDPIVVYGHKSPWMIVAFLACAKSGHAYVPIDISVPVNRVDAIIQSVQPPVIITTEAIEAPQGVASMHLPSMYDQIAPEKTHMMDKEYYVKDDDVFYIIFTSGSTGTPKGVQITYHALNQFVAWALSIGSLSKTNTCFINQAPFSFDLSVMDLYMCLASESSLYMIDKATQSDYKRLFAALEQSGAAVWVSTPSFADVCLADPSFSEVLMPNIRLFLFCGEVLTNKTAAGLLARFPKAEIYNTYGPTESTVAVTETLVDHTMLETYNPIPVGHAKPGTTIQIMDGDQVLADGEKGEIVIFGDTVSVGYLHNAEETKKRFFRGIIGGKSQRAYRTGDKGYLLNGQLFYCGRIDLQIKLHGYRLELEDVEKNLMKVEGVQKAVALPIMDEGKVRYIKAFCVYDRSVDHNLQLQKKVKKQMASFVPDYMIPRKIVFVDEIPMTANGKADRRRLQEMDV